jgi:hypothetical protein
LHKSALLDDIEHGILRRNRWKWVLLPFHTALLQDLEVRKNRFSLCSAAQELPSLLHLQFRKKIDVINVLHSFLGQKQQINIIKESYRPLSYCISIVQIFSWNKGVKKPSQQVLSLACSIQY